MGSLEQWRLSSKFDSHLVPYIRPCITSRLRLKNHVWPERKLIIFFLFRPFYYRILRIILVWKWDTYKNGLIVDINKELSVKGIFKNRYFVWTFRNQKCVLLFIFLCLVYMHTKYRLFLVKSLLFENHQSSFPLWGITEEIDMGWKSLRRTTLTVRFLIGRYLH